jgi:hypothetical protein
MASYVLKHARVNTGSITSTTYSTKTTLLTVAASHLYILKGVKATINITSTGGAISYIGDVLSLTDTDGSGNETIITPLTHVTSAGVVSGAKILKEWAAENSSPIATNGLLAATASTVAVADVLMYGFRHEGLHNMHLEAGQVLKYVPYSATLSSQEWSVTTSLSASIVFDISYIDYTL